MLLSPQGVSLTSVPVTGAFSGPQELRFKPQLQDHLREGTGQDAAQLRGHLFPPHCITQGGSPEQ